MIFDKRRFVEQYPGYDFYNSLWDFDVPEQFRIKTFDVELTDQDPKLIQQRVLMARTVLNEKAKQYLLTT